MTGNNSSQDKVYFNSFWYGGDLTPTAVACINSFRAHGFGYHLYTYDVIANVPQFVNIKDAEEILPRSNIFFAHGGIEHYADVFRYHLLNRAGGWWVDTDVVCNTDVLPEGDMAFAIENKVPVVGNGQLKFPKSHPVLLDLIEEVKSIDPHSRWGSTGPIALTKIIEKHNLMSCRWDTADLFPLNWVESLKFHLPEYKEEVIERTKNSKFIHLYTSSSSRYLGFNEKRSYPIPGSFMYGFYMENTPPSLTKELLPLDAKNFRKSVQEFLSKDWVREEAGREGVVFSIPLGSGAEDANVQ